MTIDELLQEIHEVAHLWFVSAVNVDERTDATVTVRLRLTPNLFVQVFCSERSDRFSLALVGPSGRIYGRDQEHGLWHRHPFANPDVHEPTPEGMSPQPVRQFLAEVEQILLEHNLI